MQVTLTARWTCGFMWFYSPPTVGVHWHWFKERNIFYVIQVEIFLAKVFGYSSSNEEDEDILYVLSHTLLTHPANMYPEPLTALYLLISMAKCQRQSLAVKFCKRKIILPISPISFGNTLLKATTPSSFWNWKAFFGRSYVVCSLAS